MLQYRWITKLMIRSQRRDAFDGDVYEINRELTLRITLLA